MEATRQADIQPGWEKWVAFAEKTAWPAVALLALFLFRKAISGFLDIIGKRATKISIGGLGIDLPKMSEAQLGDEFLLTIRDANPLVISSSSAQSSLFALFRRVWSKNSCSFAVVIFEQSTEPFSTFNGTGTL